MLRKFSLILPVAALLVGCRSEQKTAREQELEKRVQELEQQLASPSPAALPPMGGETALQPAPEAAPAAQPAAPAPVERVQTTRRRSSAAPSRRTARGDVRTQPAGRERFGRTEPLDDDNGNGREAVEPRATSLVLPAGTELTLLLETPISSATSNEGDAVVARVERAVSEDGRIVLPGGAVVRGRVTEARPSGRVAGRARVAVDFDSIVVRGRTHELDVAPLVAEAPGEGGRDAKIVGGSAAAGAVIGAIAGGKKGAARGALIGAGAGGAAVLVTKGRNVEMPAGSRWTVRVRDSVRL